MQRIDLPEDVLGLRKKKSDTSSPNVAIKAGRVRTRRQSSFARAVTTPLNQPREEIIIDGRLCAIILSASFDEEGIQFFTPNEMSQQLASMSYKAGKVIPAHTHNRVLREASFTQEALFIRKGTLRVDFYTQQGKYRTSRILTSGDVIMLISGGHGFEVLEDLNMIEVKQGPYVGAADKKRFKRAVPRKLNFG